MAEVQTRAHPPEGDASPGSGGSPSNGSGPGAGRRGRLRRALEALGILPEPPEEGLYHGFISYSHAADGRLAPALQTGLQRFARPWYRTRALHVFRDDAVLSANPHLWSSICQALDGSRYFILLASRDAASSEWVAREADRWRQTKQSEKLLVGLTDGELVWDEDAGDFDWRRTNALPETLRGAFDEEPRYLDLRWARDGDDLALSHPRFREAVAELAAPLHGRPKDELASEEVRLRRRAVRLARAAVVSLAILVLTSLVAVAVALTQRSNALHQASLASSRQLAATAETQLGTNLDAALLLAVRAYRENRNPQTLAALLRVNTASPHLVRYVSMGSDVTQLAGTRDGRIAVAGLADGRVMRWDVVRRNAVPVARLRGRVTAVAASADGSAIAASDGSRAVLVRPGSSPGTLAVPPGEKVNAVAVSPSGRTVAVHGSSGSIRRPGSTVILRFPGGRAVHPDPVPYPSALVAPSDDELLLFDLGGGPWERRRVGDWSRLARGSTGFGVRGVPSLPSADGRRVAGASGSVLRVVSLSGAPVTARAPVRVPSSLALSPDGATLAVGDSGNIYVTPVAAAGRPRAAPVKLAGGGSVNTFVGLSFLNDGSRLVAATGDQLAFWDLDQVDRLARMARIPLPTACNACPGPDIAVSPSGARAAVVPHAGGPVLIQPLGSRGGRRQVIGDAVTGPSFSSPVWDEGGRQVVLPVTGKSSPSEVPAIARVVHVGRQSDGIEAAGLSGDGRTLMAIGSSGRIYTGDAATGRVLATHPVPPGVSHDRYATFHASVSAPADRGVLVSTPSAWIVELSSGRLLRKLPTEDVEYAAYGGRRLLVQQTSGELQVWDRDGRALERTLPGDRTYFDAPVPNADGTLVARRRTNGAVEVDDLRAGVALGSVSSPGSGELKTGVAFSPAGRRLVSASSRGFEDEGVMVQRDLAPEALIRTACATAGRQLSQSEWRAFVGTTPPDDLSCR
ncbi:MAG TPA: hypothetical protein VJT75_05190 [Thermoleophilaceae bacterium]|nr:hypothetical protein [Thermoleophilaceae bacterium]